MVRPIWSGHYRDIDAMHKSYLGSFYTLWDSVWSRVQSVGFSLTSVFQGMDRQGNRVSQQRNQ